jgi:microcystin-dependent protein
MAEAFIGEIRMVGFDYAPDGQWLPCDGQTLSIQLYTALFSLLGVRYGGDGRSTFNLPNLNGKNLTTPIMPLGSNNTTFGQIGTISIPPRISSSTIPAQNISFTLLNTKVI